MSQLLYQLSYPIKVWNRIWTCDTLIFKSTALPDWAIQLGFRTGFEPVTHWFLSQLLYQTELSKQGVKLSLIGTPRSICSLVVPARILFADGLNRYVESAHRHCSWLMCVITLEKFAHNRCYTANQLTEYTCGSLHDWIQNASFQLICGHRFCLNQNFKMCRLLIITE